MQGTCKESLTSVDYKYTGKLNALCGILGREEELNNQGGWVTHEGNAAKTGVDEVRGLESHISYTNTQLRLGSNKWG